MPKKISTGNFRALFRVFFFNLENSQCQFKMRKTSRAPFFRKIFCQKNMMVGKKKTRGLQYNLLKLHTHSFT